MRTTQEVSRQVGNASAQKAVVTKRSNVPLHDGGCTRHSAERLWSSYREGDGGRLRMFQGVRNVQGISWERKGGKKEDKCQNGSQWKMLKTWVLQDPERQTGGWDLENTKQREIGGGGAIGNKLGHSHPRMEVLCRCWGGGGGCEPPPECEADPLKTLKGIWIFEFLLQETTFFH